MGEWTEWSDWLREGYFIRYTREGVTYYEQVVARDFAHYVYDWPETVNALSENGPTVPANLEVTVGYDDKKKTNRLWQLIFGIDGEIYVYVELPTDTHRHGIPKLPKPSSTVRTVSHYEEWMSPFIEPTFITEHFMMKPDTDRIAFDIYNPNAINMPAIKLRFLIAKMITERIGTEYYDEAGLHLEPTRNAWSELLDKLYRRVVYCRPITILPITAPAVSNR